MNSTKKIAVILGLTFQMITLCAQNQNSYFEKFDERQSREVEIDTSLTEKRKAELLRQKEKELASFFAHGNTLQFGVGYDKNDSWHNLFAQEKKDYEASEELFRKLQEPDSRDQFNRFLNKTVYTLFLAFTNSQQTKVALLDKEEALRNFLSIDWPEGFSRDFCLADAFFDLKREVQNILYDKNGNPRIDNTWQQSEKTKRRIAKALVSYLKKTYQPQKADQVMREGVDSYKVPYLWNAYLDSNESKNPLSTTASFLEGMAQGVGEFFHDLVAGAPQQGQKIRDNEVVKDLDARRDAFKKGNLLKAFEIADKYWDTSYYNKMIDPLKESFFKVNTCDGIPRVCIEDDLWVELPQKEKNEFKNNLPQKNQRFNFHKLSKLHRMRSKLIVRYIERNTNHQTSRKQKKLENSKKPEELKKQDEPHPDEQKNLDDRLEDFDPDWLDTFPFESLEKKEEPRLYPLKNPPQTLNYFDLEKNSFVNHPQDVFINNLLKSLEEFQDHGLNKDEKSFVKNMSDFAVGLQEKGDYNLADEAFSGLCAVGRFAMGVAGQVISRKAVECAVNWAIRMAPAAAFGVLEAHPVVAAAACISYVCYFAYSNLCAIPQDLNKMTDAWQNGEYENLGAATTQLAFDTTNTILTFSNVASLFKKYNASKAFDKGAKKGLELARQEQKVIKDSQELVKVVKDSSAYTNLLSNAEKSGLSPQAFEKWLEGCCNSLNNVEHVNELLGEMIECQKLQGQVTPKGLSRPITYDIPHIFNFFSKDKKISGGHSDFKGRIQSAGEVLYRGMEMGPDGIYRAWVSYGDGPGKESSFFPQHMDPPTVIRTLNELIVNEDFSKKVAVAGKYRFCLEPDGYEIVGYVTKVKSNVQTVYPTYEDWLEPLSKKLFQGKK